MLQENAAPVAPISLPDTNAGTSASILEGLNRAVGDGLSTRDWFATKKTEEAPVKLPWEATLPEELPYERLALTYQRLKLSDSFLQPILRSCDDCSCCHSFSIQS